MLHRLTNRAAVSSTSTGEGGGGGRGHEQGKGSVKTTKTNPPTPPGVERVKLQLLSTNLQSLFTNYEPTTHNFNSLMYNHYLLIHQSLIHYTCDQPLHFADHPSIPADNSSLIKTILTAHEQMAREKKD